MEYLIQLLNENGGYFIDVYVFCMPLLEILNGMYNLFEVGSNFLDLRFYVAESFGCFVEAGESKATSCLSEARYFFPNLSCLFG